MEAGATICCCCGETDRNRETGRSFLSSCVPVRLLCSPRYLGRSLGDGGLFWFTVLEGSVHQGGKEWAGSREEEHQEEAWLRPSP